MPLPREVDFLPDGDVAFCAVRPTVRQKARLVFYDWDQVESNRDDGRFDKNPPAFQASVGTRELLQLAKYLLQAAGHHAADSIVIPLQPWDNHFAEGEPNEEES
jgi:hypothetical protein